MATPPVTRQTNPPKLERTHFYTLQKISSCLESDFQVPQRTSQQSVHQQESCSTVEPLLNDTPQIRKFTSVLRTLCYVPNMLFQYEFIPEMRTQHLSIYGTSLGPQGVNNKGVPLHIVSDKTLYSAMYCGHT